MRVPLRSRWAIGFAVVGVVVRSPAVLLRRCALGRAAIAAVQVDGQQARVDQRRRGEIPGAYLTTAEQHQLLVYPGQQTRGADGAGGPSCEWRTIPATEGVGYLARMLHGPVPAGRPAASIYNMPTVEYTPADLDPRTNCGLPVDRDAQRHAVGAVRQHQRQPPRPQSPGRLSEGSGGGGGHGQHHPQGAV